MRTVRIIKKNKRRFLITILAAMAGLLFVSNGVAQPLSSYLIVGYWQNWPNSPNSLRLTQIPIAYDVINISFAIPDVSLGANMQFAPDPTIYPIAQDFSRDIDSLQAHGKKVLISIGGATGPVQLHDSLDVQTFVTSVESLIDQYGFDGMDIDLESPSLILNAGDTDFRSPTTPTIINLISAIEQIMAHYDDQFILSMAPETAFVQGAYNAYGGIWGAYLPVIHALRQQLTYIHVQHYNTGSMFGRDGNIYEPATADFHVAMADMLLAGFNVHSGSQMIFFPPLQPEQVLIGLPASPSAAGSGYTAPNIVRGALDYLILGQNGYSSEYALANPQGYPAFRGLMTWSINWDVANGQEFSNSYRGYLDSLQTPPSPPTDVTAYLANNQICLRWSAVAGAVNYHVYSASLTDFVFTDDLSGIFSGTTWTAPVLNSQRIYYVTSNSIP